VEHAEQRNAGTQEEPVSPAPARNRGKLTRYTWSDLEPRYRALVDLPLTEATLTPFMEGWSELSSVVEEINARLYVGTLTDTEDEEAHRLYRDFLDQILPESMRAEQVLKEKLLSGGLAPPGMQEPLRRMRAEVALFRAENVPLLVEEEKLCNEYHQILGEETVQWESREIPVAQLQASYQSTDRATRERSWRLAHERLLQDKEALDDLWIRMLDLRQRIAANAGLESYRAYRWRQLRRLDYCPEDMLAFHEAIHDIVVPAVAGRFRSRQDRLGVDALRPWDLYVDPSGGDPLQPFEHVDELPERTAAIFRQIDPGLGEQFDVMRQEQLLDLDSRKNKAPGGFCIGFPISRRPFIFMNAVDVHRDVETLLHEGGHAFHFFASDALPFHQQKQIPMEFAEVASMSMEYLGAPYLDRDHGGFYTVADAARARVEHLDRTMLAWPRLAAIDAFQHWAYLNPEQARDPVACDERWADLWRRYVPLVDWSGLDRELRAGWRNILHIFVVPFYIIEYCLAELGAVQVWRGALDSPAAAIGRYKQALALGGTRDLRGLFAAAGAQFAFDAATLGDGVELMLHTIASLESQIYTS